MQHKSQCCNYCNINDLIHCHSKITFQHWHIFWREICPWLRSCDWELKLNTGDLFIILRQIGCDLVMTVGHNRRNTIINKEAGRRKVVCSLDNSRTEIIRKLEIYCLKHHINKHTCLVNFSKVVLYKLKIMMMMMMTTTTVWYLDIFPGNFPRIPPRLSLISYLVRKAS